MSNDINKIKNKISLKKIFARLKRMTSLEKTIIMSILGAFLAVGMLVGGVYAWFVAGKTNTLGGFTVGVVEGSSDDACNVNIVGVGGGGGSSEDNATRFLPGEEQSYEIVVENTTPIAQTKTLSLGEVLIKYPQSTVNGFTYPTALTNTLDYYVNGEIYNIDGMSDAQRETFFKNFIEPMSNAIKVKAVVGINDSLQEGYIDYILYASAGATTELSQLEAGYVTVASDVFIPLNLGNSSGDYTFVENGDESVSIISGDHTVAVLETDGRVTLMPNMRLTVTLSVYFDPAYYPSYNAEGVSYELHNSNPFYGQYFYIKLRMA